MEAHFGADCTSSQGSTSFQCKRLMEEPVTHRAAVLQYATGQIQLESEAVESIKDSPGETFEAPVAYAVFIFGEAPRRSFDPKDDLAPEKVPAKQIVKDLFAEPQEQWLPHQPGVRDIAFPGLQGVPQWMLSVLRRIHVNLGHPGTEALVRHLAQAGAAGDALLAAKHLQWQHLCSHQTTFSSKTYKGLSSQALQ